jgi:hypothetical protein
VSKPTTSAGGLESRSEIHDHMSARYRRTASNMAMFYSLT